MRTRFLDLAIYANAHAATYDTDRAAGFVNAWRNSFPAEELPFGQILVVGGIAFQLPEKIEGAPDHVEALGQQIATDPLGAVRGLAVLGFGELGAQVLALTLEDRLGGRRSIEIVLPNWLAPSTDHGSPSAWRASHLHYAAGYELDHLRPGLHSRAARLSRPVHPVRLILEANPLAHVMAVTMLPCKALP